MKTIKDYFNKFEQKVVGIEGIIEKEVRDNRVVSTYSPRDSIVTYFGVIKRFIRAQQNLENQRDLWNETVNFLNASKAFDNEKEEIRKELLTDCSEQLRKLNKKIIRLQLHTQKTTTVEGNAEKANKPDTTVEGNAEKANKPDEKFNWQGEQAQLVYLIEQLYEHGFLSPILQPDKHRLTAQHFTVKGKNLNQKNLARTKQSYLNNKGGKPRKGEKIDQIISAAKNQNP